MAAFPAVVSGSMDADAQSVASWIDPGMGFP